MRDKRWEDYMILSPVLTIFLIKGFFLSKPRPQGNDVADNDIFLGSGQEIGFALYSGTIFQKIRRLIAIGSSAKDRRCI